MSEAKSVADMTRGEKVCAFIENYCTVPEGDLVGRLMKLEPFQRDWLLDVYDNPHGTRLAILSIGKKNGKGLALDTPIPTPRGWTTMGALREGDTVFDETGAPCRVTYESPVHIGLRCWRLVFSDGTSVVADENHRWITRHRPWESGKRFARPVERMVTTPEIAASVDLGNGEHNHGIRIAGALQTQDVALPLDPYLLGCWLGDGDCGAARLTCGEQDLGHFVRAVGDGLACVPGVAPDKGTTSRIRMSSGRGGRRCDKFQSGLRQLGMLERKQVPAAYLWAGTAQRRALLQGLMDTDGTVTRTGRSGAIACSFANCDEGIARAVLFLVRSLGMKARMRSRPAMLRGRQVNTVREIQFTAYREDAPFRLARKLERLKPRPAKATRAGTVRIVSCEPVESVPTKCIVVDSSSHQFLCGEGHTPTHNTPLIAALVLAHLAGPEARTNSQIVSGAMSQIQASTVFKYAWKMVQASRKLQALVRVQPSLKTLQGLAANVEYRAISRQKKTAHGIAPVLAILDELGQLRGPQDDFVEAIETALGAYDDSMLIVISTQAASDADLLSTWIDDQIRSPSPTTVCHVHAAKAVDCDVLDEVAWREANPALGIFRSEKDLRTLAEKASRMPAFEGAFRNLNLNQRVAQERLAFAPSVWRLGAGTVDRARFLDGRPVHVGLDLSARTDLTAAVAACEDDEGNVHMLPFCYTPESGLEDRARRDRAPYDVWVRERKLFAVPGFTIDYDWLCADLLIKLLGMNIASVQFDRWRIDVLKAAAERTRFARMVAEWQEVGQGYRDLSPRLEAFEAALLGGRLRHGGHPLLTMGAANAIAVSDPAGARKLDKSRSTQRIDPLVAAIMACFPALPEGRLTQEIDVLALVA